MFLFVLIWSTCFFIWVVFVWITTSIRENKEVEEKIKINKLKCKIENDINENFMNEVLRMERRIEKRIDEKYGSIYATMIDKTFRK